MTTGRQTDSCNCHRQIIGGHKNDRRPKSVCEQTHTRTSVCITKNAAPHGPAPTRRVNGVSRATLDPRSSPGILYNKGSEVRFISYTCGQPAANEQRGGGRERRAAELGAPAAQAAHGSPRRSMGVSKATVRGCRDGGARGLFWAKRNLLFGAK